MDSDIDIYTYIIFISFIMVYMISSLTTLIAVTCVYKRKECFLVSIPICFFLDSVYSFVLLLLVIYNL